MRFSVLMSVYKNSKVSEVKECLESLYNQTIPSDDIVIVLDGFIEQELHDVLQAEAAERAEIQLYSIETNVGLGNALKYGMEFCKHELIARMDTDDIAVFDRFEKQLRCFEQDEELSIVGADIAEFIGDKENIVSYRRLPSEHEEICKFLKKRCPFNHMTVMFKKSEVEKAGGYLEWYYNEDSYLWVRMFLAGSRFKNIPEVLVYARIDRNTFRRRGGMKYYKSERDLFKFMKNNKIISGCAYFRAKFVRFLVYVLLPNGVRAWLFKRAARKTK
ncbi:MAG: glycosyltransferase [Firmicutes bacterium]|nr:glycosyltransferase [Bacillota bacterium]